MNSICSPGEPYRYSKRFRPITHNQGIDLNRYRIFKSVLWILTGMNRRGMMGLTLPHNNIRPSSPNLEITTSKNNSTYKKLLLLL